MRTLALLFFVSVTATAQSRPEVAVQTDCLRKVKVVQGMLQQAESPQSTGQIEPCIPSKTPKHTTREMYQLMDTAYQGLQVAFQKYLGMNDRLGKVASMSDHGDGHICGAPDDVKSAVSGIYSDLQGIEKQAMTNDEILRAVQKDFERQYKGRWRKLESLVPLGYAKNCKDTSANVNAIVTAFSDMNVYCKNAANSVKGSSEHLYALNDVLSRGCKVGKPHCEGVAWAGDRQCYNWGIDYYDEYGTLVDSKVFCEDTLEKRNDKLEQARSSCAAAQASDK